VITVKLQDGLQKAKLWAVGPKPDTNIVQELTDMIVSWNDCCVLWCLAKEPHVGSQNG